MEQPLHTLADSVPATGRNGLVLVDGRTFAISDETGNMWAPTHGLVHDDLRHLTELTLTTSGVMEPLASTAPTPLSAVVASRITTDGDSPARAFMVHRRWVGSGLRDDLHISNPSRAPVRFTLSIRLAADFAHLFDVKAGRGATRSPMSSDGDGWRFVEPESDGSVASLITASVPPDVVELAAGELTWHVDLAAGDDITLTLTVEPVADGEPAGLAFRSGEIPSDAVPMRRQERWMADVPSIASTDPRMSVVLEQALADIAGLRIVDSEHPERVVIAAGAPWFMTLFGRDSLLTSWMTLPFDADLARGVLASLAELQGVADHVASDEQPGKILHELRRRGGGGPFALRDRYYGSVDATPLFVMLAAEAFRWGALGPEDLRSLGPHVDGAIGWLLGDGDSNGDGFVDYRRRARGGLDNQGWKDSWDGVTFADGRVPEAPIALAEVQGYTYAALIGAELLIEPMALGRSRLDLRARADELRAGFNDRYWDPRGWFVMGLDGDGERIDALATNAGHALWSGIADDDKAMEYLDRFAEHPLWSGWGLRTLADSMAAYDPLSYHNGSVWPHDTAICAAGAARYGRWDVVDQIVDGAFDAAVTFGGRPPELFAGIDRGEVPVPVAYPASCSPQAWSSASTLLLIRTMLDLRPTPDRSTLEIGRTDLEGLSDLTLERITFAGQSFTVDVRGGMGTVAPTGAQ